MNESGIGSSRRQILRYCSAGLVAGFAGCLGDDVTTDGASSDGDETQPGDRDFSEQFDLAGDGSERFADWLAPEATHPPGDDSETLYAYQDFEVAAEQGIQNLENYRQHEAEVFGAEPESLEGEILIGNPEEQGLSGIHLGEFDTDSIISAFEAEGGTVTREYQGYTVFENRVAIGEDALIQTPEYDRFIDAKTGDGPHLSDEYDGVDLLLALQPAGIQISASRRMDVTDLSVTASSFLSVGEGGTPDHVVRTFVFETADDASVERAEEIAAMGNYQSTISANHHDRVVMLEYEA